MKQLHPDDMPPAARARRTPKPKPKPPEPPATTSSPKALPRYITLDEWAASQFSRPPHYNTLIAWVRDGRIHPQPVKIGRAWRVRPHAEYVCD
ncbi:excisionase [Massilia sp. S19_KUP03_FR1]|uniref:excisionase n=1 Tax=Massilia sp. S19_KUP03_FR1 TaxID=3025503 RepID=UPI002FCCFE05